MKNTPHQFDVPRGNLPASSILQTVGFPGLPRISQGNRLCSSFPFPAPVSHPVSVVDHVEPDPSAPAGIRRGMLRVARVRSWRIVPQHRVSDQGQEYTGQTERTGRRSVSQVIPFRAGRCRLGSRLTGIRSRVTRGSLQSRS